MQTNWNARGETHPGKKRENNEDRILCDDERGIFVVADGMGGEAAGEVAAEQAIEHIKKRLREETGTAARRLREAIAGANNEIFRLAERNPEWRGMACVLTAALIEGDMVHVGHVGDSRMYEIRGNTIRKVTPDHSPVGQREDSGELTELEAMRHPRRNEVYRDVGSRLHKPDDPDFIEYLEIPFERDAAYLLCSDGLSDMLSSREILGTVLDHAGDPRASVAALIEKANAAGGKDNIAVIVVEGDRFAAPGRAVRGGGTVLQGRWAFLLYGLLAGLLASFSWFHFFKAEESPAPSLPVSVPQSPGILRVDRAGSEYPTIASALAAARAGDRIEIGAGIYEEAIRLKDGVELFAQPPGKAVLLIARAIPDADAAIIAEGVKNAGVRGLIVKAEPGAGLPFGIRASDSDVTIDGVEVAGAVRAGLSIDGNSAGMVSGCFFHDNAGPGVVVAGTATPVLTGNFIGANGKKQPRAAGLHVIGNSNPEARRNVFSDNGAGAVRVQRPELQAPLKENVFMNSGRTPVVVER